MCFGLDVGDGLFVVNMLFVLWTWGVLGLYCGYSDWPRVIPT